MDGTRVRHYILQPLSAGVVVAFVVAVVLHFVPFPAIVYLRAAAVSRLVMGVGSLLAVFSGLLCWKLYDEAGKLEVADDAFDLQWERKLQRQLQKLRAVLRAEALFAALLSGVGATIAAQVVELLATHPTAMLGISCGILTSAALVGVNFLHLGNAFEEEKLFLQTEKKEAKQLIAERSALANANKSIADAVTGKGWPYTGSSTPTTATRIV